MKSSNMKTETLAACGLCFNVASVLKYEFPQKTLMMLEMLNVPKVILEQDENQTFCNSCVVMVKNVFDFKTLCIERENNRMSKTSLIIDRLSYENPEECRLCNNFVCRNSTVLLLEMLKEINMMTAFQKVMPEIDLDATENPLICKICQTSLSNFSDFVFLLSCIDAQDEENNKAFQLLNSNHSHLESNVVNVIKDSITMKSKDAGLFCEDLNESSTLAVTIERSGDSGGKIIEAELKKVVSEDYYCTKNIKIEADSEMAFNEDGIITKIKQEVVNDYDNADYVNDNTDTKNIVPIEFVEYQLKHEKIDIKSEPEQSASERSGTEEISAQSTFISYQKCTNQIPFTRTNAVEAEMHKCQQCTYQTKFKHHLTRHMLTHKDHSERQMIKCEKCNYQAKHKYHLRRHMLTHKAPDEIEMYKCLECTYQTKLKHNLKGHMVIHKNSDDVKMYKCHLCTYQTKFKCVLKRHILTHLNSHEIEMHKCQKCPYQTKFKGSLKGHMITHKNSSEVETYKCLQCSYQTKFKNNLKGHMITHKNANDIEMYRCQKCSYKGKFKRNLKRHMLTHKNDKFTKT